MIDIIITSALLVAGILISIFGGSGMFIVIVPIPALDGGRILFLVIEKIRRKPVSRKVQDIAINVTYYALLALILYVTINDVLRIVR